MSVSRNRVRVWNVATGVCERSHKLFMCHAIGICALPLGRVVIASRDTTLRVIDVARGEEMCRMASNIHGLSVCALPNGRVVSSSTNDNVLRMWNVRTGECELVLAGHTDVVYRCAHSLEDSSPPRRKIRPYACGVLRRALAFAY